MILTWLLISEVSEVVLTGCQVKRRSIKEGEDFLVVLVVEMMTNLKFAMNLMVAVQLYIQWRMMSQCLILMNLMRSLQK